MAEQVIRLYKEGWLTVSGLAKALMLGWIDEDTYNALTRGEA